ncbi:putative protein OS=Streptomyces microflavus OX=1919 GN=Smic_78090 PE=4 SV=1 [Streptomyces microflavus]|uniref:Uncharacterized protein n=1 Tax=Streptomyces microflavus TaxID=1919 RepID=A0A7J0D3E9_STRMI|nr:hypothetical protein Smic_78090 [Streptomyces microflavus]
MVEVRIGPGNVVRELADQLSESEDQMFRGSVFAAQTAPANAIEQFAATTPLRLVSGHLQGCFDLRSSAQTQTVFEICWSGVSMGSGQQATGSHPAAQFHCYR